jgi:hypothetical protein
MIVTQALTLLAAAEAADRAADAGSRQADLAVTATVVRSAEVSTTVTDGRGEVVTSTSSGDFEIVAERGTVTRLNGSRWIVSPAGAEPVIVTLIY